ncbi:MAG: PKD domain-containing protein, partial [Bacteroidetes bacterium]|nr:PKD domain-containing protein [Bacteroidota bacterium]
MIVLDNNGVVQGQKVYPGSGSNKFQSTVTGSPFGDPMFAFDMHSLPHRCEYRLPVSRCRAGLRCAAIVRWNTAIGFLANFTAGTLPFVGVLGSTVAPSLTLSTDNLAFSAQRQLSITNNGTYTCMNPCLSVTTTPQGGGQVAFNDNTFGFYSIFYDFGDGTTGTTNDPVHSYPPYGTWPVTVIATNGCGSDTFSIPVHACSTAVVSGPANICVNSTNTYTETSGLNPTGLSWLVNGVSMGTGSSFSWTPTVAGTYTLGTVYYDAPCRDTTWRTVLVSPAIPVAGFTYAVTAPGQLTFTNTSTLGQSYSWAFGDGTTSTVANPVKTYFAPYVNGGNFNICLTATNACGSNTYCYNFTCPIPYSNFSITSTAGLTATITNAAVNGTISWDFGDGTTATGVQSSHTYALPGTYVICQTVS